MGLSMQGLYWSKMVRVSFSIDLVDSKTYFRMISAEFSLKVSQSSVRSCRNPINYPLANNWDWRLEMQACQINQTKWHNVAVEPLTPFCLRYPSQTARRTGLSAKLHDWISIVGIPLRRILDILNLFLEAPPYFENCHRYHPVLKSYQIFFRWVAKQSISTFQNSVVDAIWFTWCTYSNDL